jgi:hypothetical protein
LIYDLRNGHKGGVRVGFININDMYNNDVGKGGAYAYEAYQVREHINKRRRSRLSVRGECRLIKVIK